MPESSSILDRLPIIGKRRRRKQAKQMEQLEQMEKSQRLYELKKKLNEYGIEYREPQAVENPRQVLKNNGVSFSDYNSEGNPNKWASILYEYAKLYYEINYPGKYAVVEIDKNFNLEDTELSILKQLGIDTDPGGEMMDRIDNILDPKAPITFIIKVDMEDIGQPTDINQFQSSISHYTQHHQQEVTTIVFTENGTPFNMSNNWSAVNEILRRTTSIFPYPKIDILSH